MKREPVRLELTIDAECERILRSIGEPDGLTAAEVAARVIEYDLFEMDPDESVAPPDPVDWKTWARYHRRLAAVK